MKTLILAALPLALAACVTAVDEPDMAVTEEVTVVVSGPPFITTMDASVSDAARAACVSSLTAQVDGAVTVVGTEFSEANSAVYMHVGEFNAPSRCLVSNDGIVAETMFMGDEGAL